MKSSPAQVKSYKGMLTYMISNQGIMKVSTSLVKFKSNVTKESQVTFSIVIQSKVKPCQSKESKSCKPWSRLLNKGKSIEVKSSQDKKIQLKKCQVNPGQV